MATLASIRSKLQSKVFDKLGTTCVVSSVTSASTDKWGDASTSYATGNSYDVVPYDYVAKNLDYRPFGNLVDGTTAIILPYTATLNRTDKVVWNSTTYIVTRIEQYIYDGGVVAIAALLSESLT